MILPLNSIIRKPISDLPQERVVVYNAIRYSIDICQISHERLLKNLSNITEATKFDYFNHASVFSDIWTIINHSVILKKIIAKHFKNINTDKYINEINQAKDLRDSTQHIDERVSPDLITNHLPIFGIISWLKLYPNSDEVVSSILYSGAYTNKVKPKMSISNRPAVMPELNIQRIEYTNIIRVNKSNFIERQILINKIMLEIKEIVILLENELTEQFPNYESTNRHEIDLRIQLKGKRI